MDPLTAFLVAVAAKVTADGVGKLVSAIHKAALAKRADLQTRFATDPEGAFRDAVGVLEALAGSGEISIASADLRALSAATFDHQNGFVLINNTRVEAPFLQTGGTGVGKTHISGNTELKTPGTSIKLKGGASITMTGNATIKQKG